MADHSSGRNPEMAERCPFRTAATEGMLSSWEPEPPCHLLNAVMEGVQQGIRVWDTSGRVVHANQRYREIFGLGDGPAANCGFSLLQLDGTPVTGEHEIWRRALGGEAIQDEEYIVVQPDGQRRQVVVSSNTVEDNNGNTLLIVDAFADVTDLRRLNQSREQQLKILSHDLRSPLAVVTAGAQLLSAYPERSDMVRRNADRIGAAASRIDEMTRSLLDLAAFERGLLRLSVEKLSVRDCIEQLVEGFAGVVLDARRVKVLVCPDDLEVEADHAALERILLNLLSNALKYSPEDTEVALEVRGSAGETVFSVIDHGIGIDAEQLPRLLEPSYRTATIRQPDKGMGLGLFIAKGLTEAHGGRLQIESEPGCGTKAMVVLPNASEPA